MTASEAQPEVTAAVVNFNGAAVIAATLEAVRRLEPQAPPVFVIDNGSTDGSPELVRREFPAVEVVELGPGRTHPSRARNWALENLLARYLLLLDNDVVLEPAALGELLAVMQGRSRTLACAPRIVYAERPSVIYQGVGRLHFLCVSGTSQRDRGVGEVEDRVEPTLPGGNVLVDRGLALELGGWDPGYDFGWGEDAELWVRGRLAGLEVLHVPSAVGRHPQPGRGARAAAQVYNRHRMLRTVYAARSLMLLAPPLLVFEAAMLVAGLPAGLSGAQLRAWRRIWGQRRELTTARRRIQATRRRRDSSVLEGRGISGGRGLTRRPLIGLAVGAADAAGGAWWRLVRRWL